MPQKRGKEEKIRTYHLDALCRAADTKLGRNTGRYVTGGRSSGFAKRLGALLDQAEQIRDAGDLSCAFSFSIHIFFLAERKEVEDFWGDFGEQENRFVPSWETIYADADEALQDEMLRGFADLLRQEEIPDEKKEKTAKFVFCHYSWEPYVEPLLKLVQDVWRTGRRDINGSRRTGKAIDQKRAAAAPCDSGRALALCPSLGALCPCLRRCAGGSRRRLCKAH